MAWTEQAWRFSLAGIPDPSQGLDEQQTRLSLALVSNASDLSVFTPLALDYDEALSFHGIPEPSGFNVTTRYALAHVPAVGLSDSINRDGSIGATLDGFTVDFDGTNTLPVFDGDLSIQVGGFTPSIVGEFGFRHYFDISYSVTPTWVVTEIPANFGDLAVTVGGFTLAYTGFSLPPDSTQGSMNLTLGGFVSDLDGTLTSPASRDGDIGLDVEAFSLAFAGTSVPVAGNIGSLSTTLGGFTPGITGTFEKFNTDGQTSLTLGEFNVSVNGIFATSDSVFGEMPIQLADFTLSVRGSHDPSPLLDSVRYKMHDAADVREMNDSQDIRDMK